MSAGEDTVKSPAGKPLRDLDRFSKSTYPIDSKLVDGQQATAPMTMKHRVQTFSTRLFCKAETTAPIGGRRRGAVVAKFENGVELDPTESGKDGTHRQSPERG
jgi:hypothetical protein